ncbi:MAG: hypothetical protein DI535_21685 [Citrobacter freundii]|nr:MAG: hypothetical protein DI535_21685 [Citrobacter freundii]
MPLFLIAALFACNNESKTKTDIDSLKTVQPSVSDSTNKKDSTLATDTSLLDTSRVILTILKNRDFEKLSSYICPSKRLRFSAYAFIDTSDSRAFTPYELRMAAQKSSVLVWGSYDASGDPIKMNIKDYWKKFVYNKDYLNAPERSVNKFLKTGNSLNNLKEIYPHSTFTEFYFPGFEKKYEGMDWQTLRLVFQEEGGKLYLVAVVHDEWTI